MHKKCKETLWSQNENCTWSLSCSVKGVKKTNKLYLTVNVHFFWNNWLYRPLRSNWNEPTTFIFLEYLLSRQNCFLRLLNLHDTGIYWPRNFFHWNNSLLYQNIFVFFFTSYVLQKRSIDLIGKCRGKMWAKWNVTRGQPYSQNANKLHLFFSHRWKSFFFK